MALWDKPLRLNLQAGADDLACAKQLMAKYDALYNGMGMAVWRKTMQLPNGTLVHMGSHGTFNSLDVIAQAVSPAPGQPQAGILPAGRMSLLLIYRLKSPSGTYQTHMAWLDANLNVIRKGLAASFNWTILADSATPDPRGAGYKLAWDGTYQFSFAHRGKFLYFVGSRLAPAGGLFTNGGTYAPSSPAYGGPWLFNPANQKFIPFPFDGATTYPLDTNAAFNRGIACFSDYIYMIKLGAVGGSMGAWMEKYTCDGNSLTLIAASNPFPDALYAGKNAGNILPDGTFINATSASGATNTATVQAFNPWTGAYSGPAVAVYSQTGLSGESSEYHYLPALDAKGFLTGAYALCYSAIDDAGHSSTITTVGPYHSAKTEGLITNYQFPLDNAGNTYRMDNGWSILKWLPLSPSHVCTGASHHTFSYSWDYATNAWIGVPGVCPTCQADPIDQNNALVEIQPLDPNGPPPSDVFHAYGTYDQYYDHAVDQSGISYPARAIFRSIYYPQPGVNSNWPANLNKNAYGQLSVITQFSIDFSGWFDHAHLLPGGIIGSYGKGTETTSGNNGYENFGPYVMDNVAYTGQVLHSLPLTGLADLTRSKNVVAFGNLNIDKYPGRNTGGSITADPASKTIAYVNGKRVEKQLVSALGIEDVSMIFCGLMDAALHQ
jgi:hypothetical protein